MPASDQQRQQLLHICGQLREALESSQTLGGSSSELAEVEATLTSLNRQMAALRDRKMLEFYNPDYKGDFRNILPCSPLSGYFNPIAPELKIWREDEFVYAEGSLGKIHEGPPASVHGGVISGIYDQVLAFTGLANELPGMTASLTIKYHRPTPLFKTIRFTTWLEKKRDRHIIIHGECHSDGTLLTSAEGLFIQYKK
ncbi:PaaI family thioesterase [Zhongshania arctica]|uniref:Acyl-coenzyme A thioesterase THEM4 n=1 Tax=Zhongshania arctica TaxID=3238302 RepID=A0ABV3TX66_9GAMM|tara:strand:+ start:3937 stop:4530 length:594 start_codon:yes stop_codon:yes gene_type:complete